MPGQLFVEERVVRRQQIDDAAVRPSADRSRNSSVSRTKALPQVVVEPGKLPVRVRRQQPDVAGLQPLAEEVVHERRTRARVGEHPPHLLLEDRRRRAAFRESPGRAVRRPGCCSTGRTTGATPARHRRGDRPSPGRRSAGSASIRNRKSGLTSTPFERGANAGVEVSAGPGASCRSRAASARRRRSSAGDTHAGPASTRIFVAHAVSSAALGGWQTKMRRRLGESCGTRPLYGPPISSDEMESGALGHVGFAVPDRNASRTQALGLDAFGLERWWRRPGRRPALSGTRTCSASSAYCSGFFEVGAIGIRRGELRPPPIVNWPTRAPSTRISICVRHVQAADDVGIGPSQPNLEDVLAVDAENSGARRSRPASRAESLRPDDRSATATSARSRCL